MTGVHPGKIWCRALSWSPVDEKVGQTLSFLWLTPLVKLSTSRGKAVWLLRWLVLSWSLTPYRKCESSPGCWVQSLYSMRSGQKEPPQHSNTHQEHWLRDVANSGMNDADILILPERMPSTGGSRERPERTDVQASRLNWQERQTNVNSNTTDPHFYFFPGVCQFYWICVCLLVIIFWRNFQ